MDFDTERENNIVKNIANEIALECLQLEVTQELASYLVKLKLLNPKHGFTASKVMPRSQTQQLVEMVVNDLQQDTPAMDCIRMQVFWNNVQMSISTLKSDYLSLIADKAEGYLTDILVLEATEPHKIQRLMAQYILIHQNLRNANSQITQIRETMAALNSIAKIKDIAQFAELKLDEKLDKLKTYVKRVIGIRLFLKYTGKAGEGLDEVRELLSNMEFVKEEILDYMSKLTSKIDILRQVITNVIPINLFRMNVVKTREVILPPECDMESLNYLKKILVIMIQHHFYLCDILSKVEEIDAATHILNVKYEETLEKLRQTIREREAVPTVDVFDDFDQVGELWENIQCHYYCFEAVYNIAKRLEEINQAKYFGATPLEKIVMEKINQMKPKIVEKKRSIESVKSTNVSLQGSQDFYLEFNGFCAYTLYYTDGLLIPGTPDAGVFQYLDRYYAFKDSRRHELWAEQPQFFLMEIYEYLRENPEMIDILNAYESLYTIRNLTLIKDVDRKAATSVVEIQTELHPVPEFWDKDYTFSIWELKKRALSLSRIVKCETRSVQTVSPHSHFRASIGILAAPDKDKEVQTKRDSSCVHSTISNYLYGLRGHQEDKFRVVDLTRPIDETFEKIIILENEDPCRDRRKLPKIREMICSSTDSDESCFKYTEILGEYNEEF